MPSTPLVTVVIPAFNAEPFIQEAIASVRRQTLADWELIVVDDGSADQTFAAATQAAGDDTRIRIARLERNQGISAASNTGFDAARGEFIARVDSDDVIVETRLARQVSAFLAHDRLAAVGSHVRVFGDGPDAIARCFLGDATIKAHLLDGVNTISGGTMMVRRAFVQEHAIRFNESFVGAEDLDYLTSIIAAGGQLDNVDEILTGHRSHGGSFTASRVEIGRACLQRSRKRLLALWYPHMDPADLDDILATFFPLYAPWSDALFATVRAIDRLVTARANDFGQDISIVHQIIFDRLVGMAGVYRDHKLFNASHRQAMRCFVSPATSAALERIEFETAGGD
jgi:glycosyltransferase involved in cell wall biosynthesis